MSDKEIILFTSPRGEQYEIREAFTSRGHRYVAFLNGASIGAYYDDPQHVKLWIVLSEHGISPRDGREPLNVRAFVEEESGKLSAALIDDLGARRREVDAARELLWNGHVDAAKIVLSAVSLRLDVMRGKAE